ncbi:putative sulfate transporter [Trifolium pratense]|uniref:Putative sulfate transporter n=1 Tax=Trifolium pratense TaxID=57577 RepID=A0A2K3MN26_TRIPR|nr:putative sulfate transporter [Trifolium pratense]
MALVNNAKEFFQLIFSSWSRWDSLVQPYRRGAWVRLYGIPLQAWNANFFKLCVFYCGRFLRVDSCSVDKDRLDYARVLIATSDLEFVNKVVTVLVDGLQVEVKIVEERCFALGEDTCLFEEGSDSESYQSDNDDGQGDPEVRRQIDTMVENFAKGVEEAGDIGSEENFQLSNKRGVVEGRSEKEALVMPGLAREATLTTSALGADLSIRSTSRASDYGDSPLSGGRQDSNSCCSPIADAFGCPIAVGGQGVSIPIPKRSKRAQSCPPGVKNTAISGPWSLEWLQDRNQGDVGVLFSANKWPCKGNRNGDRQEMNDQEDPKRRKGGGVFRHTISSIKKVARMPSTERGEVLKVLKKNERRRRVGSGAPRPGSVNHQQSSTVSSSSVSANNDWQHWVVKKGSEQVVADDVREVGKTIGVKYNGVNENMFSVLARKGISKKTASGQTQGGGSSR